LADLIEIGYGSQCWKLEVTPSGRDLLARRLSTFEAPVSLVNLSHSDASRELTFSDDIGLELPGTDLKVLAWCGFIWMVILSHALKKRNFFQKHARKLVL
jgi:hypothetical protein